MWLTTKWYRELYALPLSDLFPNTLCSSSPPTTDFMPTKIRLSHLRQKIFDKPDPIITTVVYCTAKYTKRKIIIIIIINVMLLAAQKLCTNKYWSKNSSIYIFTYSSIHKTLLDRINIMGVKNTHWEFYIGDFWKIIIILFYKSL